MKKLTGVITGIGSMPELSTSAAAQWVVDHWSDLPHLSELPSRGPWSAMVGRAGAFLPELPLDLTAHGWRVTTTAGSDQRRVEAHLRSDIDALEDALAGERMQIKTQVAGPWTLVSALEGSTGRRLLQDRGACRELTQSLAEGIALHVARVGERRLARFDQFCVEVGEGCNWKEDFAAHLDQLGEVLARQGGGDIRDRAHIEGDIFTGHSISARECARQAAVFIEQVHSKPIDLQFAEPLRRSGCIAFNPSGPGAQLLHREGVVQTHNSLDVIDGSEFGREAAHRLSG